MDDDDTPDALPPDLERLIAGTLALMTTWYQCPQPAICRKLVDNLAQIGGHETVSEGLRRVCANAAARWSAYLVEAEQALADCSPDDLEDEDEDDETVALRMPSPSGPVTLH